MAGLPVKLQLIAPALLHLKCQDKSSPDAGFLARKTPGNVWWPGRARTRGGA